MSFKGSKNKPFGWTRGRGREDKMVEEWKKEKKRWGNDVLFFVCLVKVDPKILWVRLLLLLLLLLLDFSFRLANHEQKSLL